MNITCKNGISNPNRGGEAQIAIDADVLRLLTDCARVHVEDVESGIEDGTYSESENKDLAEKRMALDAASELVPNGPDQLPRQASASTQTSRWFALIDTGEIVSLGKFENFHAASDHSDSMKHSAVWILDEETAWLWKRSLNLLLA